MQIVDEQGNECPVGVEGEIVVDLSLTRPVGLFTRYVVGYKLHLFPFSFFFVPIHLSVGIFKHVQFYSFLYRMRSIEHPLCFTIICTGQVKQSNSSLIGIIDSLNRTYLLSYLSRETVADL